MCVTIHQVRHYWLPDIHFVGLRHRYTPHGPTPLGLYLLFATISLSPLCLHPYPAATGSVYNL